MNLLTQFKKINEKHLFGAIVIGCFLIGFLTSVLNFPFIKKGILNLYRCPFHYITGLKCPGCGMTRAFLALGEFNFSAAFNFNVLSPIFFYGIILWIFIPKEKKIKLPLIVQIGAVVIVIGYGVVRNLSY